jgi:hypothetical protein
LGRAGRSLANGEALTALPHGFLAAVREHKRPLTRNVLLVSVAEQRMWHVQTLKRRTNGSDLAPFRIVKRMIISTSRFGIGQVFGSNRTPLGLHRIARKIGADQPVGTVFKSRKPIGTVATVGIDKATICHRILWLDGLEPGLNRGGDVDTFKRYIYIHGFGDETTLGKPQSHGCIHVASDDLLELFDSVPRGTLVWIQR